ncbi:MAG: AAA family ATPase [Verrucomicrobiae bacterium]|nr:AAA family ATPase [Verrucomicrobiae bacterium]
MLRRLRVQSFKSLSDVEVELPRLTVLFGPNAAGKSNVLDAVQALSRIGTTRTISDALSEPIRGYPIEAFSFPHGGLAALLSSESARFSLEADLAVGKELFRYRVAVEIQPGSGGLSVQDEYLAVLGKRGDPKGNPAIERVEIQSRDNQSSSAELRIRRKSRPAHPRQEPIGLNHSLLSDPRLSGVEYRPVERCRNELAGWRTYYLDPRVAMRSARPPADVRDIGVLGEDIAPFLYRLRGEFPKHFEAVKRTLRSLIPSVEDLVVDLDKRRGTLDIQVRQAGTDFSSRIVSEGTLRVLALCAIAVNPWSGGLLAFEEPENGVHPRRLELIVELLCALALEQGRQLLVTTHSSLFCDAMLRRAEKRPREIALLRVRQKPGGSDVARFDVTGPLFQDREIAQALTTGNEDGLFESLMLRGMLDE